MKKLLIVDDSEEVRTRLKDGLGREYPVLFARDGLEALDLFRKNVPTVVALDLGLPPDEKGTTEGFRCLRQMIGHHPAVKIVVITGSDGRRDALRAMRMGAYDSFQKTADLEELKIILRKAFHLADIEAENSSLHASLEKKAFVFGGMLGQSPGMLDVFSTVRKVSSSNAAVLIQGDSGTGKELVARAVHAMGLRKDGPFVPINCGAIPEHLLESELFGHEKGAFTGAHALVQGKVEYADRGTLFLDEVGELPANLQVKLLRFLQEKVIQRVGGRQDLAVDTRIIAATNRELSKEIRNGRFREDLYYRLGVVTINLPSLRARKCDIMLLASFFLKKFSKALHKKVRGLTPASVKILESYDWPGNVRELENRIQRAVILSESAIIEPHDLGFSDPSPGQDCPAPGARTLREARNIVEREMVLRALDKHQGNIAKAAEELGVSRPALYDIMKKHGLYSSLLQT